MHYPVNSGIELGDRDYYKQCFTMKETETQRGQ